MSGMREYTVQQGETLEAIVAREGNGITLQQVRDEPANAALFSARQENQLRPGDIVRFPDPDSELTMQTVATGMRHEFVIKAPKRKLRFRVCIKGGEPYLNAEYDLDVEGEKIHGSTDQEGFIDEVIPSIARKAKLTIDGQERELQVGALDPIHTKTGIQARLNNLGYPLGKVDGIFGPKTIRAIKAFQHNNDLEVDGEVGTNTRAKLLERYGC